MAHYFCRYADRVSSEASYATACDLGFFVLGPVFFESERSLSGSLNTAGHPQKLAMSLPTSESPPWWLIFSLVSWTLVMATHWVFVQRTIPPFLRGGLPTFLAFKFTDSG